MKKYIFISFPLIISIGTTFFINTNLDYINIPPFMPPSYLFGIIWSIIYIIMGISFYLIKNNTKCLISFSIQFILNILWPFIFFNFQLYGISVLWLILLILSVNSMLLQFKEVSNILCNINLLYFLWLLIAYYLCVGIYLLN